MGALAQEVGLRREAKRAFPQDHANRRGFLGSGSVAELKGGEVSGVAVAQELKVQKTGKTKSQRIIKHIREKRSTERRAALPSTGFGTSLKVGQQYKSARG